MRPFLLVTACLSMACASASVRPAGPAGPGTAPAGALIQPTSVTREAKLRAHLERADANIYAGCYDCLAEARAALEEVAGGADRPRVVQRLFEVNLLLTIRERELALDGREPLERARALVLELPRAASAAEYVEIVDAIPWDDVATPRRDRGEFVRAHRAVILRTDQWHDWLAKSAGLAAPVRAYIASALACSYPMRRTVSDATQSVPSEAPPDMSPLVAYRIGICPVTPSILEEVRRDVPRFVETSLFLARYRVPTVDWDGPARAQTLLAEVRKRFPESPAAAISTAQMHHVAQDFVAALRFYDETIARRPGHEDALLGRAAVLTFLNRSDEAIATATQLIQMNELVAEGYYWRARNHYLRQELSDARLDIDQAKKRLRTPDVVTLAGIIEAEQHDLDAAATDLMAVRRADAFCQNCTARWYLGVVQQERGSPAEAAGSFTEAIACYDASARAREAVLETMQRRVDLDPLFRAGRIAELASAIAQDRGQQSAAAYLAAVNYYAAGNMPKAVELADVAARDPDRRAKADELKRLIRDKLSTR